MKKKIQTAEIADKISVALSNVENSVPRSFKETFTFKGRKSPEIICKVLEVLTNENDVILDPFLGTGMSIIATQRTNRKFFGIELDNYTYAIDKVLFEKIDYKLLASYFKQIEDAVKEKVMYLYETDCCGEKNYIKKVLFDPQNGKEGYYNPSPNREIVDGCNIKLIYKCHKCGSNTKKFEDIDWNKLIQVSKIDVSSFPKDTYLVNSRIGSVNIFV